MAIYHCSAKVIGRSSGRSATGAAAYRAGEKIVDHRTGLIHDYTRKGGVDHAQIIAPAGAPEWATDRSALWNEVEAVEKRKDAQLCREVEVAIPRELTVDQQRQLVLDFAQEQFVARGMVADVAFHHQDGENPHAHILLTTRTIGADGFGQKAREWNDRALLEQWRSQWAEHANRALERAGHAERIDHRSLADQGIDRQPTQHLGPTATAIERRTGEPSRRRLDQQAEQQAALERLQAAAAAGVAERQGAASVVDLQTQLGAAMAERDALILRASQARDALFERYKAGPQAAAEIELAKAYGLGIKPATAAQAEQLQRQVDSRMRRLDEIEAQRAAEAAAPKPTLAELIQQPQRAPEPAPKVDRSGTDLGQLLAQGERVTAPPSPSVAPQAQPEPAPALTLGQHQAVIERRIKERTEAIGREREAKATAPARERLQAAQERLQAGRQRIQGEDRQAFGEASAARTAQRTAEAEAKRLAGEAEQWRAAHWMQTKLGRTGPADDLDRQAEQHRRHAQEQARKADEAEARREALAREERQLEREVEQAERGVEAARQEARRKDQGLDGYTAARQVIDEYRRDHPDYAQQADQRAAQERERREAEEAQREAERQAQREQQQDRGRSM